VGGRCLGLLVFEIWAGGGEVCILVFVYYAAGPIRRIEDVNNFKIFKNY
jgi:hypothetical protein